MDSENVVIDSKQDYPVLLIPKTCTTLDTDCEMSDNVYIEVNITTPDTKGNETRIYSGLCNIKLVETYNDDQNSEELLQKDISGVAVENIDIDQMPVIFSETSESTFPSYNQSQVWIDPCRSPYVYNRCESPPQTRCFGPEPSSCITVEQHNTYITQNFYNYAEPNKIFTHKEDQGSTKNLFEHRTIRKVPEAQNRHEPHMHCYEEDELECGVLLSNLPEEIMMEEQNKAREESKLIGINSENSALKQLMSTDMQSASKQRNTILFIGPDSQSGQTIHNISISDPSVTCMGLEVDHEVVIENSASSPAKKMYQCDKCKIVFGEITKFHQHTMKHHSDYMFKLKNQGLIPNLICSECGKNFKDKKKFDTHCLGHGDPDLECPKCHKVYASKFTLQVHLKIHYRKFPCNHCIRTYATASQLKEHLRKVHFKISCKYEDCLFTTVDSFQLDAHHQNSHINMDSSITDFDEFSRKYSEIFTDDNAGSSGNQCAADTDWRCKSDDETVNVKKRKEKKNRRADSVIAKVMSNKMFLLNSKSACKAGKNYKTCQVCSKSFDRISDLKRHLIEHIIRSTLSRSPSAKNGILHLVCEVCKSETFSRIDKYKTHLREHAKLTIYKCTFCDKSFSDSSNFSKHKKIHGISYFQCDMCLRKFNSKKTLTQHMEHHKKNKPLRCRYCGKVFYFKSMLSKHMKSTHTRDITFKCRFCKEAFKHLKEKWDHEWLVHHIRKMIIDCVVCGDKFRKYSELKRHCHNFHDMDIPSASCLKRKKRSNKHLPV